MLTVDYVIVKENENKTSLPNASDVVGAYFDLQTNSVVLELKIIHEFYLKQLGEFEQGKWCKLAL